jgi:hypothetical protein
MRLYAVYKADILVENVFIPCLYGVDSNPQPLWNGRCVIYGGKGGAYKWAVGGHICTNNCLH